MMEIIGKIEPLTPPKPPAPSLPQLAHLPKNIRPTDTFGISASPHISTSLNSSAISGTMSGTVSKDTKKEKQKKAKEEQKKAKEEQKKAKEEQKKATEMPFNMKTIIAKLQVSENSRTPPKAPSRDPEQEFLLKKQQ
jgi:hypothetical protein